MRGAEEEEVALRFLQARGLKLVARNWRCRGGELDLVMRDGDTLVVAEVRKRARQDYGDGAASVTARKQARIVHAARNLLARRPEFAELPVRFDVCALDAGNRVSWLRAAFEVNE